MRTGCDELEAFRQGRLEAIDRELYTLGFDEMPYASELFKESLQAGKRWETHRRL